MIGLLCILLLGIAYLVHSFYKELKNLPPGPRPLPGLGNLMTVLNPPYMNLDLPRLKQKFGGVFTFHMPFPVVNVCEFETLRDLAKTDTVSGRPYNAIIDMMSFEENSGLTLSVGDNWREQRRSALSIMRDFGMGRNMMEERVRISAREFIRYLHNLKDFDRVDMKTPIHLLVGNVINEMLFGFRYPYDDCDRLFGYIEGLSNFIKIASETKEMFAVIRFPWLRRFPYFAEHGYDKIKRTWDKLATYIREEVEAAEKTAKEDEDSTCFVHEYMKRGRENAALTRGQMLGCCSDLFLAGQETTSMTLRWAVLFLAGHQEAQDKIREEIERVIGSDRLPVLADKTKMPYTQASIHEIQRRANIIPALLFVMRKTTTEVRAGGHSIPSDTLINPDLHMIHQHDPLFVDPMAFRPERYLADDGVTLRKELVERTIPFGIGKRMCAGEGLARVELFMGLTTLLQSFRILPSLDGPLDYEPIYANTLTPKPHLYRLVPLRKLD